MATASTTRRRRRTKGVFTRSRGKLVVVSAATIVCVYLCFRLARPFLPALVWATTGAVVTHGFARWLGGWIKSPGRRAAMATGAVTILMFLPVIGLVYYAAVQIYNSLQNVQPDAVLAYWDQILRRHPASAGAWDRIAGNIDLQTALGQLAEQARNASLAILSGFVYVLVQAAIALFILFFLYRDGDQALATVRRLSPLTSGETTRLLKRIGDTIHATIAGIVVVAIVQGTLGGIMFAILGLPAPVLLGTAMVVMAMVPYLGTFIIWGPAAIILAVNGQWEKALVLVAWGILAIGLIDNLLYPILVGNRLRQHTVIAFLSILGGLAVFGATGIVLGPVIVALTFFLLEVWRRRTEAGRPAECA
jgi:predicted PurR-regulated permease PerM